MRGGAGAHGKKLNPGEGQKGPWGLLPRGLRMVLGRAAELSPGMTSLQGTLLLCQPSSPFPGPAVPMLRAAGCPPREDPGFWRGEGGNPLMLPRHSSACLCSLLGGHGLLPRRVAKAWLTCPQRSVCSGEEISRGSAVPDR